MSERQDSSETYVSETLKSRDFNLNILKSQTTISLAKI